MGNSKFKIQNSKFKIQNSKFKIQNSKFKIRCRLRERSDASAGYTSPLIDYYIIIIIPINRDSNIRHLFGSFRRVFLADDFRRIVLAESPVGICVQSGGLRCCWAMAALMLAEGTGRATVGPRAGSWRSSDSDRSCEMMYCTFNGHFFLLIFD